MIFLIPSCIYPQRRYRFFYFLCKNLRTETGEDSSLNFWRNVPSRRRSRLARLHKRQPVGSGDATSPGGRHREWKPAAFRNGRNQHKALAPATVTAASANRWAAAATPTAWTRHLVLVYRGYVTAYAIRPCMLLRFWSCVVIPSGLDFKSQKTEAGECLRLWANHLCTAATKGFV